MSPTNVYQVLCRHRNQWMWRNSRTTTNLKSFNIQIGSQKWTLSSYEHIALMTHMVNRRIQWLAKAPKPVITKLVRRIWSIRSSLMGKGITGFSNIYVNEILYIFCIITNEPQFKVILFSQSFSRSVSYNHISTCIFLYVWNCVSVIQIVRVSTQS